MIRYPVALGVLVIAVLPCSALSLVVVRESIQVDIDFEGDSVAAFALPAAAVADAADVTFAFALIGPIARYRLERRGNETGAHVFYAPSILSIAAEPDQYDRIPVKVRRNADLDPVGLIQLAPTRIYADPPDWLWYAAFDRLKTEAGLFWIGDRVVRLDGGLIRADLPLPAQSPVGDYRVRAVMFRNGEIVSEAEKSLILRRRGVEGFLYALSRRSGLAYGVLAVFVALLAGTIGAWFGRS